MSTDAHFSAIKQCIDGVLDSEALRMYELRFETLTENKKPETIKQEFLQLIKSTDKVVLKKLQRDYAHDIQKLNQLLIKAKEKSLI